MTLLHIPYRSLWNIRNYVHIMLCVSLLMAQAVFVCGVDIPEKDMVKVTEAGSHNVWIFELFPLFYI